MMDLFAEIVKYMNARELTIELFLAVLVCCITIQRLYSTDKKTLGVLTEIKILMTSYQTLLTLVKDEFKSISSSDKEQDKELDKRFEDIAVQKRSTTEKLDSITDHLKEIKKTLIIYKCK